MIDQATLKACLEQRITLASKMQENIEQMELQLTEEDPYLDSLIDAQNNCMQRIDKCGQLIKSLIEALEEPEKSHWDAIVSGHKKVYANLDEQGIGELVDSYQNLIRQLTDKNNRLTQKMQQQHTELKAQINKKRNPQATAGNMFY